MTEVAVGTIDVFLVRQSPRGLEVLVLRRAEGMRCAGAWEVVHGRIEPDERPEDAALREMREETGLEAERLYSIRCISFYVPRENLVNVAVVFAAFVAANGAVKLAEEHSESEWLPFAQAVDRLAWPSARDALRDIQQLLASGDAGPVQDVLRVR